METQASELFEEWKAVRRVAVQEYVDDAKTLEERGHRWVREHSKASAVLEKVVMPNDPPRKNDPSTWDFKEISWLDGGELLAEDENESNPS